MITDTLTVGAILVSLLAKRLWPSTILVGAASVLLAIDSVFTIGIAQLMLVVVVMVARYFRRAFDARSFVSSLVTSLMAFGVHAFLIVLWMSAVVGGVRLEIFLRGLIFFFREFLLGVILGIAVVGIKYSFFILRYAVVEEKVI